MNADLVETIPAGCEVGEGIVWNHVIQEVQWTDIEGRRLFRYKMGGEMRTLDLPERLCAFGLSRNPCWLIAAFETGFGWLNIDTGDVQWINRPEMGNTGRRFNDGRVDRQGRFWSGTMVEDDSIASPKSAAVYCLDADGVLNERLGGLGIFNGCCWSPNGETMYGADSQDATLWRFDFDQIKGTLGNRKVLFEAPPNAAPDGADVDAEGYVWNALWGGECVIRISPEGEVDARIDVPTPQPTCVAFGGEDLSLLLVTSARIGLSNEELQASEQAGDVFIYQTNTAGLLAPVYDGVPPEA